MNCPKCGSDTGSINGVYFCRKCEAKFYQCGPSVIRIGDREYQALSATWGLRFEPSPIADKIIDEMDGK